MLNKYPTETLEAAAITVEKKCAQAVEGNQRSVEMITSSDIIKERSFVKGRKRIFIFLNQIIRRRENDTQFEFSGGLFKNLLVSKNDDKVSKANRRIFDVESKSCLKNNLLW
ncbi:unnamed protein product [Rhizophagus irregularis]|nr:unnamed protein product [Rhizophagus irregularis]